MPKNIIEKFDELELGQLEWCGNEDHQCECSVKVNEIKQFLLTALEEQKKQIVEDIINNIELDKEAHEKGMCSLSSVSLYSALEQRIKNQIRQILKSG